MLPVLSSGDGPLSVVKPLIDKGPFFKLFFNSAPDGWLQQSGVTGKVADNVWRPR